MKLVCISDTHGDHEGLDLPTGDVLVHAGDLTGHGSQAETLSFMKWLGSRGFDHTLCIAGNHDTFMEEQPKLARQFAEKHGVVLLNDSGYEAGGLRFWGSPITPRFCDWSFMRDAGEPIEAHWRMIPPDTDVLITHGPPHGIMDEVERPDGRQEKTGCPSLLSYVRRISPKVHIFGHIHQGRGSAQEGNVAFFNVSTMNKYYQRTHEPVLIEV